MIGPRRDRPVIRLRIAMGIFLAVLLSFLGVLWRLQVVEGDDYLARAVKSIATTQTVAGARGRIRDRNGATLVRDQAQWQLKVSPNQMGERREETLLSLFSLCEQAGQTWTDTLPLERTAPFALTTAETDQLTKARFETFLEKRKQKSSQTGQALLSQLAEAFQIPSGYRDQEVRALVGVLYECALREEGIAQSAYVFLGDVDTDLIAQIRELDLPGVTVEAVPRRTYETTAAAHLLGRVGQIPSGQWETYQAKGYLMNETVGREGLEETLEEALHGSQGTLVLEEDREGNAVGADYAQEPQTGRDVTLTLDLALQEKAEQVLAQHIPQLEGAQGGAAVLLDVRDGGVLAMASYPTFDLSAFSQTYQALETDPLQPLYNRALQGTYAPGSVFKLVTAVAALEEGIITPETKIKDTGRYTYYRSPQPQCWIYRQTGRTHGVETVSEAITDSCNVFFYDAGRRVGIETLGDYARQFGLGSPTGIELSGESAGVVAGPSYTQSLGETWYDGNTLSAAIGQENNRFTPLQLASCAATLASGGKRWQVHLVDEVTTRQGETVYRHEPTLLDDLALSETTVQAVKEGMLGVTQEGSVKASFRQVGVPVCAKTGSAQVDGSQEANAVFLAFAPAENPEVALALVVEKGGSGSQLGAMAAELLAYYFQGEPEPLPGSETTP